MSQYAIEDILELISGNEDSQKLNLSNCDLSGLDLSRQSVEVVLYKKKSTQPDVWPLWYSVDQRGINLARADLSRAILHGTNLWFADLRNANLEEANLQGVVLSGANLTGANLRNANLYGAMLEGANLEGAILGGANLTHANLESAKLNRARLGASTLKLVNLSGSSLEEVELWFSDLQGAQINNANLRRANLTNANLQGAVLRGAYLEGVNLKNTNLQHADLSFADLRGASLRKTNLNGANMAFSHLERVDMSVADSIDGGFFFGVFLDNTRLTASLLGKGIGEELENEIDKAREAYLILKNNFGNIGRYDDQSWAYVKECKMEREMSKPTNVRQYYSNDIKGNLSWYSIKWWQVYAKHFQKWVLDGLVEAICMYGESFWRVIATLAVVFTMFTIAFGLTGSVYKEYNINGEILLYPTYNIIDLVIFSLGAFTTMEPAGLQPANNFVQLIAGAEAFFGIALTGLLGFVLGNKIRRL